MSSLWRIELLGELRAVRGDRIVTRFRTQKTGALLAYLAYHRDRAHPRELLIEACWPEADQSAGRNNLSLALSSLRRQLEPPDVAPGSVVVADRLNVQINPAAIATDVAEFEARVAEARRENQPALRLNPLRDAIDLYRGPLLPGYYEEWIAPERERLQEAYLGALRRAAGLLAQARDYPRALDYARRAVAADPLREESHRTLIHLLAAAGQRSAALNQYRELEQLLRDELGRTPAATTRQLVDEIEALREQPPPRRGSAERPAVVAAATEAPAPGPPPSGTVTFLLTDVERSTALWEKVGAMFTETLERHHGILRDAFAAHGGYEVKSAGDSFLVAFARPSDALQCAVAAQRALTEERWPEQVGPLRVRMALHTGEVERREADYQGLALHRASRILSAAHGGQILCSQTTAELLRRDLPGEVQLTELGTFRLRDLPAPERLFQVDHAGMAQRSFPPVNAEPGYAGNLPAQFTRFFGREKELEGLQALLAPGGREQRAESREQGGKDRDPLPLALCPLPVARLVTLTGPGGTGKTRLSLEVARQLAPAYSGAAWFVPLADLTDAELIPDAVADALRLPRPAGIPPLDLAVQALSRQPSLLVLDNVEQLMDEGAKVIQQILEAAPGLACLVSSRRRLGLPMEREFSLNPLATPGETTAPELLTLYDSVRMFIDRAQAARPDFQVTNHNAAAVAELCNRLDGVPLAIELAAARAQVLSPAQMLQQLSRRFEFLVSRKRETVERHRTLRATVDWSYRLLAPEIQRCFARLSVFRGGWSLAAAEAVCGGEAVTIDDGRQTTGEGLLPSPVVGGPSSVASEPWPVLEFLEELRSCSLIVAEEGGEEVRFRMLETLAEYAAEQLAPEERERLGRLHAAYFAAVAEEAAPGLLGPNQAAWLDRLEADRENLRAALEFGLRNATADERRLTPMERSRGSAAVPGAPASAVMVPGSSHPDYLRPSASTGGFLPSDQSAIALRLGAALWRFWSIRGHLMEGRAALERMLAAVPAGDPELGRSVLRAEALLGAGALAHDQSDYAAAIGHFEEALTLWRELDERRGLATCLNSLGNVVLDQGDAARAAQLYEEALALYRELGDNRGTAMVLSNLAALAQDAGNHDRAAQLLAESLPLKRKLGNQYSLAIALDSLGNVERSRGNIPHARALYEEALTLRRELGHKQGVAISLNNLGSALLAQGTAEEAEPLFRESVTLLHELAEVRGLAEALAGLAAIAAARERYSVAAQRFGAAAALRQAHGICLSAAEESLEARWIEATRDALGERRFQEEWARGEVTDTERAVALALGRGQADPQQ